MSVEKEGRKTGKGKHPKQRLVMYGEVVQSGKQVSLSVRIRVQIPSTTSVPGVVACTHNHSTGRWRQEESARLAD